MKIICKKEEKIKSPKIEYGDMVFLDAGDTGAMSHWAIMTIDTGLIGLECGSTALSPATKRKDLYLGDSIQYWRITKIAKMAEITECISV